MLWTAAGRHGKGNIKMGIDLQKERQDLKQYISSLKTQNNRIFVEIDKPSANSGGLLSNLDDLTPHCSAMAVNHSRVPYKSYYEVF
jgi:hypothetical protein